jgi:hypothetical protein
MQEQLAHGTAPTGRWDHSRGEFVVRAGSALPSGAEVALNYNDWGSAELLQHYGFVYTGRSRDDTVDIEPLVLLRPGATEAERCQLAWLLHSSEWGGFTACSSVVVESLAPRTISDPSAPQSSVLQRLKITLAAQTAHPSADGRAAHDAWLQQLRRGSSVQELAQQLHGEMSASTEYTKAVLAEVAAMAARWEARAEALVPPDDSCGPAGGATADGSIADETIADGPSPPAVDDVGAYRAWCAAQVRRVEREIVRELAALAAAEASSL